ncbi:MAG TPA: lysophospholipid acyltransferase family protein [Polyangia bacterium]
MIADTPSLRAAVRTVVDAMRAPFVDPASAPDYGFDQEFLDRADPLLDFLWSKYFRVRLTGMEHVPLDGPALVVANHSGGLPYDGAMLIHAFFRLHPRCRPLRPLVANFAFRSKWMAPVISKIGGVRASMDNALSLLQRGDLVGVFPEGLKGVGKLYRERYRLSHFGRGGFVRLARQANVPILPVAIVGAEEIHPLLGRVTTLAKPLGLPYIPITPTFPLLGPLGLLPVPTKWSIRIGPPISIPETAGEQGTLEVAETVRRRVDQMIAELLVQRRSILFG